MQKSKSFFSWCGFQKPHPTCTGTIPSSQRKSGTATSCSGISLRKAGPWQRGFPVTIRLLLSHAPNQERRQSQLKGLARRFLVDSRRKDEQEQYKDRKYIFMSVYVLLTVWTGWAVCQKRQAGWCSAGCRRETAAWHWSAPWSFRYGYSWSCCSAACYTHTHTSTIINTSLYRLKCNVLQLIQNWIFVTYCNW